MAFWTFAAQLSRRTVRLCFWVVAAIFILQAATQASGVLHALGSLREGQVVWAHILGTLTFFVWPIFYVIVARLACEAVLALQGIAHNLVNRPEEEPRT